MDQELCNKISCMTDREFTSELHNGRFSEKEIKSLWINREDLTIYRKAVVMEFLGELEED